MKAIDQQFTKIINGTTQFVIPVFQRDYSWTEAECEQLWNDVVAIASDPTDRRHFLGSVVYVATGDSSAGFTRWLLIDGQQRVTTLTILLAALRDHIEAARWSGGDDGPTGKRIDAYFLRNAEETGSRSHKLVLRRHDQATLQAILDRHEPPVAASGRIRENYEFFRERVAGTDPDLVYRGVGRLVVVDVCLDHKSDDPQLIFESLNSTGLDLSQSDLIRNFILMSLPEPAQTRLYDLYWRQIEDLFRGSESTFDAFVRDYIALKTKASKQEKANEIYFAFRRTFGSVGADPEKLAELLGDLLNNARHYAYFTVGVGAPVALRASLARLRRQVDVPAILLMRLFECFDIPKTINESELGEAVALVESYIFRRAVCGEQTRGYWQVFADLAYQIDSSRPLESFRVAMARLRGSYKFPRDAEFKKALEEREIYGMRVCFDILERLENHGSKEVTDTRKYTIEHIMPQNSDLSVEWRQMLGTEWMEVQRAWLHRLGNLTLTGYNSEYRDKPFEAKKTTKGGFAESSVRLNRYVREQAAWTSREMEERGKTLASQALSVWRPLVVDRALIDAAEQAEMRARAKHRDVGKVVMTPTARDLFEVVRTSIVAMDGSIIEYAEQKSVSYYGPDFFLEVLPRKNHVALLLNLEFGEIDDPAGAAEDASRWKFVVNAVHSGGVLIDVVDPSSVAKALPMIRRAFEAAKSGGGLQAPPP